MRNIRPPARYGDSILSQNKRNGSKNNEKRNSREQKKGVNGNVKDDGKVSEEIRNKGKECIFDGDLNGDSFPVLQSQVNKSKPTNVTPNCDVTQNSDVVNDVVVGDNVKETTMNNNTVSVNLDNESASNSKNVHSNEVSCDGISSDCGNVASTCVENAKNAVNDTNKKNSSLVDIVKKATLDNKLLVIPTEIAEDGNDVAVFDEETVELGSVKWNRTVCGQFLGCSMSLNEARYHLRRMWYKYGLEEVTVNDRGVFFFKFSDEHGILNVISNEPWMVNNKPMFVQRWSIDMCLTGVGRLGYARVLVELDANENELVPDINERNIVDGFISNKMVPPETEVMNWNDHMKKYYKDRMELIDAANDMESEDMIEELDENEQSVLRNEVDGTTGDTFV
ncbi:hypothetical protein CTI12_AA325970 [Artemisia annua]|uniref:DUF4283 domain-containing protein n=1 Tax=Artemisia annua TaxID=35608 RepID=A0A2U1MY96_ARTAN|nr:hypothetical protein CTI12_AA325970 [Artemisia annua]